MRGVSDEFLLNMAEVSSALIGLFLVGMFFYADRGFRRLAAGRDAVVRYFRASTKIVLILFAIPIGLSLSLVVLELAWARVLFLVLSVLLLAANLTTVVQLGAALRATGSTSLLANEILGSVLVLVLVVLPWALGGFTPTREDLTWAVLLSFAAGFVSVSVLVLSVFDLAPVDPDQPN